MHSQLLGWSGLLAPILVSTIIIVRHQKLGMVILVSLYIRVVAALTNFYIVRLPDGKSDAIHYENTAWELSQLDFSKIIDLFPGIHARFYPWLMSLVYAGTGRSLLLLQSISLLTGVIGVYFTWYLTRELWGEKAAIKAAWAMALFPTVVMYSAIPLKESYAMLFILMGLIGTVRFYQRKLFQGILLVFFGFLCASFFHGAVIIGLFAFLFFIGLNSLKLSLTLLFHKKISPSILLILGVAVSVFVLHYISFFNIQKLVSFNQLLDLKYITYVVSQTMTGAAAFPQWTIPNTWIEVFLIAPVKIIYFLFSPFPWDINKSSHLLGSFDGIIYFILVLLIWRNRKIISIDPRKKILALVAAALIVAYSFAVGNFGTAIRHRSKFVPILIILAAPLIPRPVLRLRFERKT